MVKILIVEDNEMNMCLFSDLLKTKGYEVSQCSRGRAALKMIKKNHPDIVVMDIQMPEISGLELTKLIRKDRDIAHTKIVAVSAFAMKSDEERILKAGCDAYISKPISIPVFFKTIEKFLP